MTANVNSQRILLAKVGLDGHDRGIKVVARGLRDAGFHVIYSGLWQSVDSVAQAVQDEDVDWLGVSVLNGAHMTLVPALMDALALRRLTDVGVMVGGIFSQADQQKLMRLKVAACFGPGTSIPSIVEFISKGHRRDTDLSGDEISELVCRLRQRDRSALARLMSIAAVSRDCTSLTSELARHADQAGPVTIAVTGSGGVGKSSLLGAVIHRLANGGDRIGVLACDPQSPLTGGALLGDRCRIASIELADQVFLRSLSTVSGQQGIATRLALMLDLMRAYGFDRIFVETVGTGQGDTAVGELVDVVVLVLQPQTGDQLQWEKAGVLEIADVVVINKGDLPGADRTVADVGQQIRKPDGTDVAIVKTSVAKTEGLDELCRALDDASRNLTT